MKRWDAWDVKNRGLPCHHLSFYPKKLGETLNHQGFLNLAIFRVDVIMQRLVLMVDPENGSTDYTPEFTNMTGWKIPIFTIGNRSSNGGFSIVMLVFGGVGFLDVFLNYII